ncbi:MAG: glycosyltransferase [Chitinophagaceae bacterium]|nr:glycosyltransferase [Chitinophagaceae bacterium]
MSSQEKSLPKKLIALDTSYTLEDIEKRGILNSVTCRDLDGYFEHVWTVHPFATIITTDAWASKYGKAQWHTLSARHTFIEGKIGRYAWLKNIFPLNFLASQTGLFFTLRRLIKKEKISVVRVGDPLYLGLFGWLLARVCKIPLVVRVGGNHDKVFETTGRPMQKRLFFNRNIEKRVEHFVFSRANLVAGANYDNLNFALANGARKENSTIFRYGNLLYEGHFTDPKNRKDGTGLLNDIGIKPNSFLLYIGRLEKVKHPDHVLKTLADVRKNGHDVKALLVGDGAMLDELKQLAISYNVADQVVFAGNQNQEWLSRIIPLSAVVLSPHTGRALSEAALGGVAVVAYDIDWQSELIENEVTGLLIPHPQQKEFSDATERFLDDKPFAEKMAAALKEKAFDMLDPRKLNQHEIDEYNALLMRNKKHD